MCADMHLCGQNVFFLNYVTNVSSFLPCWVALGWWLQICLFRPRFFRSFVWFWCPALFRSEFARLDYHGFYTAVLEMDDVLISVACIRYVWICQLCNFPFLPFSPCSSPCSACSLPPKKRKSKGKNWLCDYVVHLCDFLYKISWTLPVGDRGLMVGLLIWVKLDLILLIILVKIDVFLFSLNSSLFKSLCLNFWTYISIQYTILSIELIVNCVT